MKPLPFLAAVLALASGCAAKHYSELAAGAQVWPTTAGAMSETGYALPVYFRWPARSYRVVGRVDSDERHAAWGTLDVAQAARMALAKGGDALIIRPTHELDSPATNTITLQEPAADGIRALVIRWKSPDEADEESHRLDGVRAYLRRSYPALQIETRRELWTLGLEYVAALRLDINTQQGAAKLEETLAGLARVSGNENASQWLCKFTRVPARAGGLRVEESLYGLATVQIAGDAVLVTCEVGEVKLNFAGRITNSGAQGELKGASGKHAFTQRLHGSMTPNRIALQSSDSAGAGRTEFLLLR